MSKNREIADRQPTLRDWFRYYFIAGEDSPCPGYEPGFMRPSGGVKWAAIHIMHYIKHPVGLWRRLTQ